MNPVKLYLLHFPNINKFYDTVVDKKEELASRIPGCATLKNRFLLNLLWYTAIVIEPIVSFVIVTCYLPVFLYIVITRGKRPFTAKHVAMCYSGLTIQRVKAVKEVYEKVDYYLYPISVEKGWVMADREVHSVLEQVSVLDVLKAYFWSIVCIFAATTKTHGNYLYRNYLCFEYLLSYDFFERISDDVTLYCVNHLDRWAVLFNEAPQKTKVLLQHGIESPRADWPVKLTNVTKAYLLAESQKPRMIKAVLGHELEYEIMPPTIQLTEMPLTKEKSIVIVAGENYMYFTQEEYIIKKLVDYNISIFVKIHPGKNDYQNYTNLQKTENNNVEVITTQTFPKVSAVVSHNSTLGLEYEAHRIPVFYYDELPLDEIVNRIVSL